MDPVATTRSVYNFVFPHGCDDLTVYGYTFRRVTEYPKRVQALQHLISSFAEFDRPISTGTHAVTAMVDVPGKERQPVIPWTQEGATALDDILLLFSIFTLRDVFAVDTPIQDGEGAITADPREYFFGLRTAIPYEEGSNCAGGKCNVGFAKGVEAVYRRIRTPEWRKDYGDGRFLPLFRAACKRQMLESSCVTCWSIWEILFTLHNQNWLSEDQIVKLPASEKIAFVLTQYAIKKSLDSTDRKGVKHFVKMRNRLVHAGRFADDAALHDATLFVRVTAIVIAKILGLRGADVLGSETNFVARLRGQDVIPIWERHED